MTCEESRTRWVYKLFETVGEGTSGCVYRAIRSCEGLDYEQEVAVKILNSKNETDLLKNEVQRLLTVRSPRIVSIYGWDVIQGCPALIMEFIRGVTLAELLNSGHLSLEFIEEISGQTLIALKDLSSAGISHGDLNLNNIIVDEQGVVKIVDFGSWTSQGVRATLAFADRGSLQAQGPSYISDVESIYRIRRHILAEMQIYSETNDAIAMHECSAETAHRLALVVKKLRHSKSIKISQTQIIKTEPIKPSSSFIRILLALLFSQLAYGDVKKPLIKEFAFLEVRTERWIKMQVPGRGGIYSPFAVEVPANTKIHLQWRSAFAEGELVLTPKVGEHIVLGDGIFRGTNSGYNTGAD